MTYLPCEVAKLWRTLPLAAYVLACLGLNLVLVLSGPDPGYPRFVASAADAPPTDTAYGTRLATDLASRGNVFNEFDPVALSEAYQRSVGYDGPASTMITAKYAAAVPIVTRLAAEERALDVYYASDTGQVHAHVFGVVMPAVTIEVFLLATVVGAQLRSVEERGGPGPVVYASRAGRSQLVIKSVAAVAVVASSYAVLGAAAVGAVAVRYDTFGVWGCSVGSSFHRVSDVVVGERPFFTWLDLSVGGYLVATLLVGLMLTAAVALASAAVGLLVPDAYLAFGALLACGGVLLAVPQLNGASLFAMLAGLNPVWLWLRQPGWFTDGGLGVPVPWFETIGAIAALAVGGLGAALAHRLFQRSDA